MSASHSNALTLARTPERPYYAVIFTSRLRETPTGYDAMADRMVELAGANGEPGSSLRRRALNQAARELLLAQSSDWAFIMKTGTMVPYAIERTKVHVLNFNHLYEAIKNNDIDEGWLSQIEGRHNLFPDLDYRVYA